MALSDARCDALTAKSTRCTRNAVFGHWDFTWCAQHIPQSYRDEWAERERLAQMAERGERGTR